ncbi:uncharacterized protein N7482_004311 [Penicillium canariense]|uniref:Thioredoxin-like protein AAED1 n=1 Tax=Penicillium canariense TaxID=189055 RepID=A0A9W9LPG3_9EURO|nr:uncharacterized protein N7482_004311 [Penicillium canariense]KAJ5168717.1 hypothetical protein N7482_004311 [Penicillium canariense]
MTSDANPVSISTPPMASSADSNVPTEARPVADDVKVADAKSAEVPSNDKPPSTDAIRKVEDYMVFDSKGEKHTFQSIYDGPDSTGRVLVIFIRHFFCGAIRPDELRQLPVPTSFAIIGCGDPGLIDFYAKETGCTFPIYADPANTLYDDLGMSMTYALGPRPEYFRKSMVRIVSESLVQGFKHFTSGLATKGGDSKRVGGEFLFEPSEDGEAKRIAWCHRMTTTRDHTGLKELAQVLDTDGKVLLQRS